MQATWSQPVAEEVVFSKDLTRRRERPSVRVGGRGDSAVYQDQLKPDGDALPVQVRQHQFAGPILVG